MCKGTGPQAAGVRMAANNLPAVPDPSMSFPPFSCPCQPALVIIAASADKNLPCYEQPCGFQQTVIAELQTMLTMAINGRIGLCVKSTSSWVS